MTRYARAKGSKACNEKTPEDSTPWELMKEQLLLAKREKEETKNRKEAEQQRIQNYENFLKEQRVQKRKATWCDFPEVAKVSQIKSEKKKKRKDINSNENKESESSPTLNATNDEHTETPPKKKKKKNKHKNNDNGIQEQNGNTITEINKTENETTSPNKNKKKKKKNKNEHIHTMHELKQDNNKQGTNAVESQEKQCKSKKNKGDQASEVVHVSNEQNEKHENSVQNKQNINNTTQSLKKKKNKLINGKPQRRKDINDKSFQLIINGKEVELLRVDGFPVMKKDAEHLNELKKNMIQKGIPKSEIQRTMKLERRRAEKALARVRKEVCYNCRKGGHNLSDCPDLKSKIPGVEAGEGICFKCGSTEHRQFECKVQRDKEFRFATCFICKEPGHIARQCPDNPKGLYPNGGCCKLCGDVTHLRKDCHTVTDKKEEKNIKLSTLDSTDDVEGIVQQPTNVTNEPAKKVKKIKF
nr:unnamed protein product [Amyelois transitella]